MSEVESGQKKISDILVLAPETTKTKIRPSRRSASDYEIMVFGHKWHNQAYAISDETILNDNNEAFEELYLKHLSDFVPTYVGSTINQETAWHCKISFEEFSEFIKKTNNIFGRSPFGDINQIMRVSKSNLIDLVVFWNPSKCIVQNHQFFNDTRSRKVTLNDEGYRVTNLHEGERPKDKEEKTYLSDDEVVPNKEVLTIQVFPIYWKAKTEREIEISGKFQYMYSLRFPKAVAMYSRSKN